MANDVAITSALRSNLSSLQNTQSLMDKSQLILSTGRKINSALDGAQAFFAAKSLNDRASDLSNLLDGLGQSISTIQSADQAVSALTKLIEQGDALATQARDEISTAAGQATAFGSVDLSSQTDLTALNGVADNSVITVSSSSTATGNITIADKNNAQTLVSSINDSTNLEGNVEASLNASGQLQIKALTAGEYVALEGSGSTAGTLSADGFQSLGPGNIVAAEGDGAGGTRVAGTVVAGNTLTSAAASANTVASDTLATAGFTSGFSTTTGTDAVTFNLTVDGVVGTGITINASTTIQDLVDGINGDANLDGAVTASFDESTGKISIATNGSVSNLTISNTVATKDAANTDINVTFGFGAGRSDGDAGSGTLDAAAEVASEFITFSGGTADVTQLQTDYNEVRTQIDNLVEDASYRGVNLLEGDNLTTAFNEDRSNTLVTEGSSLTSSGLGITQANFTSVSSVDTSLTQLRTAKDTVRSFSASIANDLAVIQTREDFTKSSINTLQSGADKLTLADQNEESARMLALQTRQQIGFISLSLASQAQQGILRLF